MKHVVITLLSLVVGLLTADGEKLALVGGTLINPANGKMIQNAIVTIDGEQITDVVPGAAVPTDAKTIDCKGKFVLPGYVDSHVHFFQSADLFTRPDVADVTKVRSYADE